jgi:cell division protein FtsB
MASFVGELETGNKSDSNSGEVNCDENEYVLTSNSEKEPQTPITEMSRKRQATSPLANPDTPVDMIKTLDGMIQRSNMELKQFFRAELSRELGAQVQGITSDVDRLTVENEELRARNRINEGRITRLEKVVNDIHEDMLQSTARSMKDNITFSNIPEEQNESNNSTRRILIEFLQNEMCIAPDSFNHIDVIRVHRVGQSGKYNRMIVAKLNEQGKAVIWSHTKHLKGKHFSVNVQLPRELSERKKQLVPLYKNARNNNKKAQWRGEKLSIDNVTHTAHQDVIKHINYVTSDVAVSTKVTQGPPMTHKGSTFLGSRISIQSTDDVIPSLHALYGDQRCARATHNRIQSKTGITEHYNDDGEYGAGSKLLDMLKEKDIQNELVCVTRWYGGTHLGTARFQCILDTAKAVLRTPRT